MHVHAHMQGEGEGATERGGDRDGKGETERCEKLLVGLPLTFRHEPTRAWLVVDIDSAPALPSLALLQAFDGEIPKRHVLGLEPAVLRKEDRQDGVYQGAVGMSPCTSSYLLFVSQPCVLNEYSYGKTEPPTPTPT